MFGRFLFGGDMQWFKHMSNMAFDPKIKRVIRKYGVEGYGLYCYVLESISRGLSEDSPYPELEEVSEDIAADLKMDSRRVEEIMSFMVNQGLFDWRAATSRIVCMKMIDYIDEYHRKKGKESAIRKALRDIEVQHCPDKLLTLSGYVAQEEEEDKEKEEEKKPIAKPKKNKYGAFNNVLLSIVEYDKLVSELGVNETDAWIKKVDEGIELKGYKYKSHYLAIRHWREKEGATKKQTVNNKWGDRPLLVDTFCTVHPEERLRGGICYVCEEERNG
jgi:hypothetical protein